MSSNFFRKFSKGVKFIFDDKAKRDIDSFEIYAKLFMSSILLISHGIYAYSTEQKDAIIVKKKYKMTQGGFTDFMIVDNKGRHFNLNNSLWYWKWNSIEDWHNIEENKQLLIRYYGWRIPVFGLFPNIYISDKEEFLDSISRTEFNRFESPGLF